jgi:hypothetical protein
LVLLLLCFPVIHGNVYDLRSISNRRVIPIVSWRQTCFEVAAWFGARTHRLLKAVLRNTQFLIGNLELCALFPEADFDGAPCAHTFNILIILIANALLQDDATVHHLFESNLTHHLEVVVAVNELVQEHLEDNRLWLNCCICFALA